MFFSKIILSTAILLCASLCYSQPKYEVFAGDLIGEFESNKLAASKKYKGQKVLIKGVVADIEEEKFKNTSTIVLTLQSEEVLSFNEIKLYLNPNPKQTETALKLKKDDFTTVICTGLIKYEIIGITAENCFINAESNNNLNQIAEEIEAISIALQFKTDKGSIQSKYVGKLVKTEIYIENFQHKSNGRRMIDANSGFTCDVDSADLPNFPSNKGVYKIQGVFVIVEGHPGISRCKIIQ